jgi:hypothetical protein
MARDNAVQLLVLQPLRRTDLGFLAGVGQALSDRVLCAM